MTPANYEGPRHGDYVRYVDDLLRASPLYRASVQGWAVHSRHDFSDAAQTPGAQPQSALEQVRERVRAAAAQAQQQQAGRAGAGPRGARKAEARKGARKAQEAPPAARGGERPAAKRWFQITPGRILTMLVLVGLSLAFPGLGAFILLFALIHAVRGGIRSAQSK